MLHIKRTVTRFYQSCTNFVRSFITDTNYIIYSLGLNSSLWYCACQYKFFAAVAMVHQAVGVIVAVVAINTVKFGCCCCADVVDAVIVVGIICWLLLIGNTFFLLEKISFAYSYKKESHSIDAKVQNVIMLGSKQKQYVWFCRILCWYLPLSKDLEIQGNEQMNECF